MDFGYQMRKNLQNSTKLKILGRSVAAQKIPLMELIRLGGFKKQ